MATGRIGVTPTLRTRWSKAPAGGTTSLSGLDDNSVSLVYDVGYEAVYRNGVLLSRTNDYTATTGNSITLIDATIAGDIIEVFANQLLPLTNAIGNGQYTAKGALLSATAASTPAVLTVGANDTVLTADSSTATGLKWATPAAGGMTLLSTTTLSGTSTDVTSISQDYNELVIWVYGVTNNTANGVHFAIPLNSTTVLDVYGVRPEDLGAAYIPDTQGWRSGGSYRVSSDVSNYSLKSRTDADNFWQIRLPNYNSTTTRKGYEVSGGFYSAAGQYQGWQNLGFVNSNSAINGFRFQNSGGTFSAGTIKVWGVK